MTERDEKDLIKKRASFKGRLTTFVKYLNDLSGTLTPQQVNELQLRIGKVEVLYDQYDEVQLKLECLCDDIQSQTSERDDFEAIYYQSLSKAQDILSRNPNKVKKVSELEISQVSSNNHKLVKLPTINLPKFQGSYNNWLEFHDTFTSLIHSNDGIDEINKFHYLRSSLESSAAVIIQSVEFSASNYSVAWQLLCDRYNNKRLLVQNHVTNLFNVDSIKSESSISLKRLIDQLNKSLCALESLGEPTTYWDTLLIHILTRKLDHKTFREWEECKGRLDKDKTITLAVFLEFIRNRADLLETLELSRSNNSLSLPPKHINVSRLKTMVSVASSQSQPMFENSYNNNGSVKPCQKCKGDHPLKNCSQFLSLTNEERLELIPQYKVCFNCLSPGHYANRCQRNGCKLCKRKHHTLVHVSEPKGSMNPSKACTDGNDGVAGVVKRNSTTQPLQAPNLTLTTYCVDTPSEVQQDVLLSTALVNVVDADGHKRTIRALLDCASSCCIITERMCHLLNLSSVDIDKPIYGINKTQTSTTKMCRVSINSLHEKYSKNILCYVLPSITDDVPCHSINVSHLYLPGDLALADPTFYEASEIDMIIGSNVFWELLGSRKINLGANKPILWETRLGWLVSGPITGGQGSYPPLMCNYTKVGTYTNSCNESEDDDIQTMLSRFWQLEEVGPKSSYSEEERMCEEHFVKHTTRLDDGRFCVRIPLKQSHEVLGDSFQRAKRCLSSLERRFQGQPTFQENYVKFMSEYLSLGHMSECNSDSTSTQYFIPHHGVLNENSTTTKLRVVFNASSPTTTGVSLNKIQMVGPTVQDDLLSILLRFRLYKYVLVADVEKMYRQVSVDPADRHLQQILWRDPVDLKIKTYQLNTVTYGCASASYLATRCLKQVGLECSDKKVSEIIVHDFYVDDLLTGSDSTQEALEIKEKVTAELASAGMPLRKWKSNNPQLIIPSISSSSLNLNIGSIEPSKTLGIGWLTESDEFCVTIDPLISREPTKRGLLSVIAQIFDPMGLVSPCVIPMKILMQKLWVYKLSWDEPLPSDIAHVWLDLVKGLPALNNLRIPRLAVCDSRIALDLHIFCDASQSAYGACLYVRSAAEDGKASVKLLFAKSKVAPLKPTTIPRLELCGALVGVRLFEKVITSLRVDIRHSTFWTDSTIVLGWLRMLPSKLQPFVRNRVVEILEKSENCTWRHVPTDQNPADHITRGVNISELQGLDLWWSGPQFLHQDASQWPPTLPGAKELPEVRSAISLHLSLTCTYKFIEFNRFSNIVRLRRAVAYVLRFINLCRKLIPKTDYLNSDELQNASNLIIKVSQSESFPEYDVLLNKKPIGAKSKLIKFNVFLDDNNVMRVGGRLANAASFPYDKKFPIVLQSTHHFTKLLFRAEHIRLMHAGPQLLLASIREAYWPIGGRTLAKSTYYQCVRCTRMKGKVASPLMGNLPLQRLIPNRPFECVGIDYAGPISSASRQGRGCKIVKVYIAIFVCFTTKAIHIELVGDLTSKCFISALRRFIARRGKPSDIYSDNGTSFVGAYNEIGKLLKNCSSLPESLVNENINFHFCPPYSPHFGGLWEAGVKSIKYHLYRVLGHCNLTYEELITVLTQIEAILNSRPLTPLSSDANDLTPLTPGHFLIGQPMTALPVPDLQDRPADRLTRFQRIEQLRQHFWTRWSKEYISELQQRVKWTASKSSLEPFSMVVVKDDNLPPLKWKLGRLIAVYPGPDGINRVADVRVANGGVIRRSFSKICPLPVSG